MRDGLHASGFTYRQKLEVGGCREGEVIDRCSVGKYKPLSIERPASHIELDRDCWKLAVEGPVLGAIVTTHGPCITLLLVLQTVFEVEGRERKTTERIG